MLGDTSGTFAAFPGQPTPMTDHAGMTVPLVQQPSVGAQPMSLAVPQYNNPESGGTAQQAPPRTAPFSVLLCSLSEDALETLPPTPPVECVQREVCGDAALMATPYTNNAPRERLFDAVSLAAITHNRTPQEVCV